MLGGMAVTDAGARLDARQLDYALREQEQAHQRAQMEIAARALQGLLSTAERGIDAYTTAQAEDILAGERPLDLPEIPAAPNDQIKSVANKAMYSGKPLAPGELGAALGQLGGIAATGAQKLGRALTSPLEAEAKRRAKRLAVERADSRFKSLSPALLDRFSNADSSVSSTGEKKEISRDEFDQLIGDEMTRVGNPRSMIDVDPVLGLLPEDMREAMAAQIRQADETKRRADEDRRWKRERELKKEALEASKAEREHEKAEREKALTNARIKGIASKAKADEALAGWRGRRGSSDVDDKRAARDRKELMSLATRDLSEAQRVARDASDDLERLRREARKIDTTIATMIAKGEITKDDAPGLKAQMTQQLDAEITAAEKRVQAESGRVRDISRDVQAIREGRDPYTERSTKVREAEALILETAAERGVTAENAQAAVREHFTAAEKAEMKRRRLDYMASGISEDAAGLQAFLEMRAVVEERQLAEIERAKADKVNRGLNALRQREAAADEARRAAAAAGEVERRYAPVRDAIRGQSDATRGWRQ